MLKTLTEVLRYILDNPSNEGQKLRRLGYGVAWQIYKRTVGLPLIVTLDNGLKYIVEPIATNATGVIYTRLYEPEYILFLREHLRPGGSMIDVGAHTGLYTLLLAHLMKGGVCFEPAADTFRLLQSNLRLNGMDSFTGVQCAVANRNGMAGFVVTEVFGGTNRLDGSSSIHVPVVRIDTYLRDNPLPFALSLLKIDVEGLEMEVLESAHGVLKHEPSALAVVENSRTAEIESFFVGLGWRVFAIDKRGVPQTSDEAKARAYNLLACGPSHELSETLDR